MNVGNALKVTCVGFAGGILLRMVQLLFFFDYETGFYTDSGVMAWICTGFVVLTAVLAIVMCFRDRRSFGRYSAGKNNLAGAVGAASGLVLIAAAVMQLMDYLNYQTQNYGASDAQEYGVLHTAFLICCFAFGAVQLFVSSGFFLGRNSLSKVPLLYLVAVLWGVSYLVLVYVFYAKASSFTENFFAVIGGVTTLMALFYLCKLFAGVDEEGAAKRFYVTGIASVILTMTYSVSNLALMLLGKSYIGEIPTSVQLASLAVSLFLLAFLFTFKKDSIRRPGKPAQAEGAAASPQAPRDARKPRARRFRAD